jgi:hypothetical protein
VKDGDLNPAAKVPKHAEEIEELMAKGSENR